MQAHCADVWVKWAMAMHSNIYQLKLNSQYYTPSKFMYRYTKWILLQRKPMKMFSMTVLNLTQISSKSVMFIHCNFYTTSVMVYFIILQNLDNVLFVM